MNRSSRFLAVPVPSPPGRTTVPATGPATEPATGPITRPDHRDGSPGLIHRSGSRGRTAMASGSGGQLVKQRCPSDRPRQNCDGGGAGRIAPLARRDGVTVQGPTVRLCYQGVAGRHGRELRSPPAPGARGLPGTAGPAVPGPFACGVPDAVRGTWALSRGLDVGERPVSRERLLRRGAYSH
jgi:hypothetical protein